MERACECAKSRNAAVGRARQCARAALDSEAFRVAVAAGAAACAALELAEDLAPGAHHGTALLATAEFIEHAGVMLRGRLST